MEKQEIEDSKSRMKALASVMPLEQVKKDQEERLELKTILEDNKRQIAALEDLLGDSF
jgi:hypothetical protein